MVERIDIVVTERGTRQVRRRVEGIGEGAVRASDGVRLLRNALGLLGIGFTIREFVRLTDTYTSIQNRLRLVTDGTADLAATQSRLLEIANRNRTDFEALAILYQRTSQATAALGISTERVTRFVDLLSQATIVSGASSIEASNAIRQLTQGLAAGALRGEEFRSVSEQLPFVLDIVAQAMGITRGEVRELAFSGQLTATTLIESFEQMEGQVVSAFGNIEVTIGQAITVFQNNITAFVGGTAQASGASQLLAQGILLLSQNLDILAFALAGVATVMAVTFAVRAVGQAIAAINLLTVAIASNPVVAGLLVVAFGAAILIIDQFGAEIQEATQLLLLGSASMDTASQSANNLSREIAGTRQSMETFGGLTEGAANDLQTLANRLELADQNFGEFRSGAGLAGAELNNFSGSAAQAEESADQLYTRMVAGADNAFNSITRVTEALTDQKAATEAAIPPADQLYAQMVSGADSAFNSITRTTEALERQTAASVAAANAGSQRTAAGTILDVTGGRREAQPRSAAPRSFTTAGSRQQPFGTVRVRANQFGALEQFQRGGSFTVGGRGGIDQNILSINGRDVARVSRGEQVNVQPRGEGVPQQNITFNIMAQDVDSFSGNSGSQIATRLASVIARNARRNQ